MGHKHIIIIMLAFIFAIPAEAQTWNNVSHRSGTQTIAGVDVTVNTQGFTDTGDCFMTYAFTGILSNLSSFLFKFSKPISATKINFAQFGGSNSGDTVDFFINGGKFRLNTTNLFSYSGLCTGTNLFNAGSFLINTSGGLEGIGSNGTGRIQVNITPSFGIDSILVRAFNVPTQKLLFDFAFAVDTAIYIRRPYTDTLLCTGDSLKLKGQVTGKFNNGNVFTAQLSDAGGSFASPVTIGTRADTLADTIKCRIPAGTTPGTGYRIRIVASSPADTSYDDGVNIKIRTTPQAVNASTNSPLCSGNSLNLNGSSSTPGVSWKWDGPGGYSSTQQSPVRTGAQTSFSGTYIFTASLDGCSVKDTEQVTVNPTPITPTAGSNSPVCAGSSLNLTATNTSPGASYNWTGPAFGSSLQNPTIVPVQPNNAGNYTVTATLGPCSSGNSTTVVVNAGPSVSAYPNPGSTVCAGDMVTLVALPMNAGPAPAYQWFKNSSAITGATTTPYAAGTVNDGDIFYVQMTAGTACNTPLQSNSVKMKVSQALAPPTISISANPGAHAWPGVEVVLKASTGNAGTHPGYQWRKNGKDIAAAKDSIYKSLQLKTGDTICCVVTSNFLCAVPREVLSNCIVMNVDLGIEEQGVRDKVKVYPNPVNDKLVIEGAALKSNLQIFDIIGREVYKGEVLSARQEVNVQHLVKGNYILQITTAEGKKVYRKFVKE